MWKRTAGKIALKAFCVCVVIVGIEYMGKKRLNVVHSVAIRKDFSSCLVIIIKICIE